jgi:ribonuclease-3
VSSPDTEGQSLSAGGTPTLAELRVALGANIPDDLVEQALTHRSYAYENGGLPTNERLEFLGDAVLGLVVTEALYRSYPEVSEGRLAKLRASVVNMRALARVAASIGNGGLGAWLRLGRGEETTGGRAKPSLLADTLEALLGAVYLTGGLDDVAAVIHRLFDPLMAQAGRLGAGLDWKTSLQELAATRLLGPVEYRLAASGPDHAKRFSATVLVAGVASGSGEGRSKKEAELRAAEAAFTDLLDPRRDLAVSPPGEAPAAEPPA